MGFKIEDGKGRGYVAEVDSENELHVKATIISRAAEIADVNEQTFSFPSNIINLTSGTANKGLFLVENQNNERLHIDRIRVSCSGLVAFKILRNPGAASPGFSIGSALNSAFGSTKNYTGSVRIGLDNGSFGGGAHFGQVLVTDGATTINEEGAVTLNKGNTIGITGKTDGVAQVGITIFGYLESD